MTTTASHLRIHNWVMTVRKYFSDNFAYAGKTFVLSYGNAVNMDNPGGSPFDVGIEVYWADFTDNGGYLRFIFRVWTRANEADDPDGSLMQRVLDTIRELWRGTTDHGSIPLFDYGAVEDPGDTPVALSNVRLMILRPGRSGWGEAIRSNLLLEASGYWRGELEYQFAVPETFLDIDHF